LMSEVDAVWTALLPRLERAEQTRQAEITRSVEIEPALTARLADLATPVTQVSEALLADPLSLTGDARIGEIETRLTAVTADLDAVVAIRNDLRPRLDEIEKLIDQVALAEASAADARAQAASRISGLTTPDLPASAVALREQVARLKELAAARSWLRLASGLDAVAAAAGTALGTAQENERQAAAPLRLRDELRGRLHAYRAKAIAMGLAEDPRLTWLFTAARDVLWTAPCDVGAAVTAVDAYVHEITGRRR